jgi:hypothetical protein
LPIRIRRLLYAAALLAPVVVAGLNAPPFIETTKAQVVITNHYFGPNSPAVFDANGNGIPGSGDLPATPTRSGSLVTLISPLDCNTGDGDNQGALGGSLNGRLSTLSRSSDGGRTQDLQVTNANVDKATGFSFTERLGGTAIGTGTGGLSDTNGDGGFEQFSASGSTNGGRSVNATFDLLLIDANNDGHPDFVTIPWALASQFGVNTADGCGLGGAGGSDPQLFVPLADSDGDGIADSIIPDLDGDGVPDGDLFRSPRLVAAAAVPATNVQWMTVLTVLLSGASLWMLRRRDGQNLTPAV